MRRELTNTHSKRLFSLLFLLFSFYFLLFHFFPLPRHRLRRCHSLSGEGDLICFVLCYLSSFIYHLSFIIFYLSSIIFHLYSVICYLQSVLLFRVAAVKKYSSKLDIFRSFILYLQNMKVKTKCAIRSNVNSLRTMERILCSLNIV